MRPLLSQIMHRCPKLGTVLLLWWGGKTLNTTVSACLHFCKGVWTCLVVGDGFSWKHHLQLGISFLLPSPSPPTQAHRQGHQCQAHFRHLLIVGHDSAELAEACRSFPLPCRHKGVTSNTQESQCLNLLLMAILDHFLQPNNGEHQAPDVFFHILNQ